MQDSPGELRAVLSSSSPLAVGPASAADEYEVAPRQVGQWSLVFRRFRRHRLAVLGARILFVMLLIAIVGPWLVSTTPVTRAFEQNLPPRLWPFDLHYLMGTDQTGLGVSTYVLAGARPTLSIAVLGALIASVMGAVVGGIAGYFGRFVDAPLMRLTDAFLTVPFLPLLMLLTLYLTNRGVLAYAVLFGIVGWAGVARLIRGYVLSIRQREFTEAARALGVSDPGVIFRHILPNALDILIVSFTLNVAVFVVTEATLEFIAVGPTAVTWGAPLAQFYGYGIGAGAWWLAVFPGAALLLTVLAVNFLGDGLRDALDTSSQSALQGLAGAPDDAGDCWIYRSIAWTAGRIGAGFATGKRAGHTALAPLQIDARRRQVAARLDALLPDAGSPAGTQSGRLARLYARPPLALQIGPIPLMLLIGGIVVLAGHSPLIYAPHYAAPSHYAVAAGESEYGAVARPGGWDLLFVDPAARITYVRSDASGGVLLRQVVAGGGSPFARPALAEGRGTALAAWETGDQATIRGAFVGAGHARPFGLIPPTGIVEHPFVLAVPGGFDVLFDWQRTANSPAYQIYLASIPSGATHPAFVRVLFPSRQHGLYPRAVLDGSGMLDLLYLDRTQPGHWAVRFRRFTPAGRSLGKAITLDTAWYYTGPPTHPNLQAVPDQWGLDLKRAPDGSVWAAWEASDGQDNQWISVAQWNRNGKLLLPPTQVVQGGFDSQPGDPRAVSLVLTHAGGRLYYSGPNANGGIGSVATGQDFDSNGTPVGQPQRVAFDGGGSAANPHAATINGRAVVVWQRVRSAVADLEGTAYRPFTPPDLITRLGLNVGSLWGNIGLVVVGALAGGFALAIINVFLLLLLLLLWLPIGRLFGRRLRWWIFTAVIGLVLAWLFGSGAAPPGIVVVIGALGSPGGWVAVLGGVFAALWVGQFIVRRQDAIFRAAAMALASLYVIGALYAVIFIQSEITRI